jgi:transcriptional regulator with XRE-family HTH domain
MLRVMREPEADRARKVRFAYVLRHAREQRALTPPQLAARLGVSRSAVNRWEDPLRKEAPSILSLRDLCEILRLDPEVFATLPPEPPSDVDGYLLGDDPVPERIIRRAARETAPAERDAATLVSAELGRRDAAAELEGHPPGEGQPPAPLRRSTRAVRPRCPQG